MGLSLGNTSGINLGSVLDVAMNNDHWSNGVKGVIGNSFGLALYCLLMLVSLVMSLVYLVLLV